MRTPNFWYDQNKSALATLLMPFSTIYRAASVLCSSSVTPWHSLIPVLCVGNVVAGGAGKTPVAISLGRRLIERGTAVHYLTRGYGGSLPGPARIDIENHTSKQTGDEALLLARTAPTWVARNRKDGILAATMAGAGTVIMDDGFQNPSVQKTASIIVVDGAFGFGNGRLIPAGPLREPIAAALERADAVALIGGDKTGVLDKINSIDANKPLLHANIEPGPEADQLKGAKVMAFAGIGLPQKFFTFLEDLGCDVAATQSFADHHAYTAADMTRLQKQAEACGARLVTTEKDAVRIPADARSGIAVLSIKVTWQDEFAVDDLLDRLFPDGLVRHEPKR